MPVSPSRVTTSFEPPGENVTESNRPRTAIGTGNMGNCSAIPQLEPPFHRPMHKRALNLLARRECQCSCCHTSGSRREPRAMAVECGHISHNCYQLLRRFLIHRTRMLQISQRQGSKWGLMDATTCRRPTTVHRMQRVLNRPVKSATEFTEREATESSDKTAIPQPNRFVARSRGEVSLVKVTE